MNLELVAGLRTKCFANQCTQVYPSLLCLREMKKIVNRHKRDNLKKMLIEKKYVKNRVNENNKVVLFE